MAAKAVKILDVVTRADGTVEVRAVTGVPPLGSNETNSIVFANAAELAQQVNGLQFTDEEMIKMHLAITYVNADGTFKSLTQVRNKTISWDSAAPQPLKVQ